MSKMNTTWDGKPIAQEPQFGLTVVVFRRIKGNVQFLLLHRAAFKLSFCGDWAWTPPAGGRLPGETPDDCARRELNEETDLKLEPQRTYHGDKNWFVYAAEAPNDALVQLLDPEHNGFRWASIGEAVQLCKPVLVYEQIEAVACQLGL